MGMNLGFLLKPFQLKYSVSLYDGIKERTKTVSALAMMANDYLSASLKEAVIPHGTITT